MFPPESVIWQVSHRHDPMPSVCSMEKHGLICPVTADVNFGHTVKVAFAKCAYYNGTTFPFVTNQYFVGR